MSNDMKTPISKARGMGSAKEGVHHWWVQRVSGIALVPLTLWFMASIVCLADLDYAGVVAWVQQPLNTALLVALIGTMCYHSQLGLQVVIEDYVHGGAKVATLLATQLINGFLAIAGILAVLRVAFGG